METVIIALDGRESERALPAAQELAKQFMSRIVIVHVNQLVGGARGGRFPLHADESERLERLGEVVAELRAEGFDADLETSTTTLGQPAKIIARSAKRNNAGAIVLASRDRAPRGGRPHRERDAESAPHGAVPGAGRDARNHPRDVPLCPPAHPRGGLTERAECSLTVPSDGRGLRGGPRPGSPGGWAIAASALPFLMPLAGALAASASGVLSSPALIAVTVSAVVCALVRVAVGARPRRADPGPGRPLARRPHRTGAERRHPGRSDRRAAERPDPHDPRPVVPPHRRGRGQWWTAHVAGAAEPGPAPPPRR